MDRLEGWEIDALESLVRQYEWSAHDYYSKAYDIEMDSDDAKILEKAIKIIKAIPSAEPSGDLISRQAAIKAIEERAKKIKNGDTLNGLAGAVAILFELPSVNQQEPCDDAISRQAVLDLLEDTNNGWIINEVSQLPSVNPQESTGHWIYDRTRDWDGECKYECSECGMGSDVDYDYCMRCGARMIEPQESEDKEC